MKLILVRTRGNSRSIEISRGGLYTLSGCFAVCLVCSAFFLQSMIKDASAVNKGVFNEWQINIENQVSVVRELERRTSTQRGTLNKQLADLNARLIRLESLGDSLVNVSALDKSDFDFSMPVAIGGLATSGSEKMSWTQLSDDIVSFSQLLKRREIELKVLDSVLFGQRLKDKSELGGYPVDGGWTSSAYGQRVDPFKGVKAWHAGVDITSKDERAKVQALANGVVTYSGERSGYGKMVEINHANGYVSRYAHHRELLVSPGSIVKKGDAIGIMGDTGRSTGPHVHLEVQKNGKNINPARFLVKN